MTTAAFWNRAGEAVVGSRRTRPPAALGLLASCVLLAACGDTPTGVASRLEVRKLGEGLNPSISGEHVVWQSATQGGARLLGMALDSTAPRRLSSPDDTIEPAFPAIDGHLVVWSRIDLSTRTSAIAIGDFANGPDTILARGSFRDRLPDVSGSLVTWERRRDGTSRVLVHDVSTDETIVVGGGDGFDTQPRVDDGRVVFTRRTTADGETVQDIILFDTATGEQRRVNPDRGRRQGNPDISGDIVVWGDATDGTPDVVYRDLSSADAVEVTGEGARPGFPAVSGFLVVWEDARNADPFASPTEEDTDIYLFDIRTGAEVRITSHPSRQELPDISGRQVVWMDRRNGRFEVFAAEVP